MCVRIFVYVRVTHILILLLHGNNSMRVSRGGGGDVGGGVSKCMGGKVDIHVFVVWGRVVRRSRYRPQ